METKQARAAVGGELGVNGEWYEGGKFIATLDNAKSRKAARVASRKQQVECFKWEVSPVAGQRALFPTVECGCFKNKDGSLTPVPAYVIYLGEGATSFLKRVADFNAGIRWI